MPQQPATAAAVGDQASQFSRLPAALLVRILQALPQRERLSSCATVCSSWAAAATAATVDVDLPNGSEKVIAAFQPWLQQFAPQLVSLTASGRIYGAGCPQLRLPCAELVCLTQLELEQKALVLDGLGSNSTAAGAGRMQLRSGTQPQSSVQLRPGPQPQLLPKLRQLKLARCKLVSVEALLQLSVLTSLTSLQLKDNSVSNSHQQAHAQQGLVLKSLCMLLAQLPQLGNVKLSCDELAGSSLSSVVQQLSSLRQLRSAHIDIPEQAARTDDLFSALPRGLTGLTVWDWRGKSDFDNLMPSHPATFPQKMPQLSDLQELRLCEARFHPGVLSVMKRLQRLDMYACTLLPRGPDNWQDAAGAGAAASAAASAFLQAVSGMTDLVSLTARGGEFGSGQLLVGGAPAAAFRALTASSKLQELVVQAQDELPLPWGAVQYAFPTGRVLPHLTKLTLEATSGFGEPIAGSGGRSGFMSAQHLRDVVRACPALVELHICNACASDDLTPLLQLSSSVTWLSLGGSALGDDSAASVAQLTQLQRLFWDCSPDLTDAGLEHLTALTGLTRLLASWCDGLSLEITDDGVSREEEGTCSVSIQCHQAGAEAGTPVWQLLCDRLEKSPQLWPARLLRLKTRWQQQLEEARAEAQQQTAALQQQLAEARAESQQQVTELQQQLAELRQQVAQMQQRASSGGSRRR